MGNPLSYRDGITMTWKNGRRLATYTKGDVSASFDYDADGLRTTKTVGTSRVDYYRAGGLLLGEVHTNGSESYTINYMYDESGRMLGFRLDGEEYYYVRDYAGDVTGLINARGELIGSYLYDPWGVLLETYLNTFEEETSGWTDADRAEYMRVLNLNPIRYKSYYYDTETGFYYLQSRYYDPITTRFINADGVVSGIGNDVRGYNMFVYCMNNPINMIDDTGNFPCYVDTGIRLSKESMMKPTYGRRWGVSAYKTNILQSKSSHDANKRPNTGEPGSTYVAPNGDKRTYGPDGKPQHDYDHNDHGRPDKHPHDDNGGHNHDWENGERGPAYETYIEPIAGVALITLCAVGIIAVAVDDATGVGIADDFLFAPLGIGISEGLIMIFD